jgi:hypothetical protein
VAVSKSYDVEISWGKQMRFALLTARVILLFSAAYSVFLLIHKILFEKAPTEYEMIVYAVQGVHVKDYPGIMTGVFSGICAPLANVFGFALGFFGITGVNESDVSIGILYPFVWLSAFGEPQFHFGFWYNVGFIVGIILVIPAIMLLGADLSKLEGAVKSESPPSEASE